MHELSDETINNIQSNIISEYNRIVDLVFESINTDPPSFNLNLHRNAAITPTTTYNKKSHEINLHLGLEDILQVRDGIPDLLSFENTNAWTSWQTYLLEEIVHSYQYSVDAKYSNDMILNEYYEKYKDCFDGDGHDLSFFSACEQVSEILKYDVEKFIKILSGQFI